MDHSASREQDVGFDLESGISVIYSNKEGSPDPGLDEKPTKTTFLNPSNINEGSAENIVNSTGKKMGKEKHKKGLSAKKPPRPPRGFSMDAYDRNLIKELAELAMIKRARIERMKALKQKKATKVSSSSSSSSSSHATFFAMLFTIVFFLVILLQGRNSGVTFLGSPKKAHVTFQGSPQMAQTNENNSIFAQDNAPHVQ